MAVFWHRDEFLWRGPIGAPFDTVGYFGASSRMGLDIPDYPCCLVRFVHFCIGQGISLYADLPAKPRNSLYRAGTMENAIDRLHRALDYAVLQTTSGSSDQRGALYARLACALTTQGRINDPASITQLPNFEALCDVLPIIVTDENGGKALHDVWDSHDFIAPAIAVLAVLFDRMTHPHGDSLLTVSVSREQNALYGYRLESLDAQAFDYSADGVKTLRPMTEKDWMKVSVNLAGAAFAFMKDLSIMRFAPFYLEKVITNTVPAGAEVPLPLGRTAFVNLVKVNKSETT